MIDLTLSFFNHAMLATGGLQKFSKAGLIALMWNWIWCSSRKDWFRDVLESSLQFSAFFLQLLLVEDMIHHWYSSIHCFYQLILFIFVDFL